jgi:uncharacterized protein YraI
MKLLHLGSLAVLAMAQLTCVASADPALVISDLRLREGPGPQYQPVLTIPGGSNVEVIGCDEGWCQVEFEGRPGYVSQQFLDFGGDRPPVEPPPVGVAPPPYPPPPIVEQGPGFYPPVYGPGPYDGPRRYDDRRWDDRRFDEQRYPRSDDRRFDDRRFLPPVGPGPSPGPFQGQPPGRPPPGLPNLQRPPGVQGQPNLAPQPHNPGVAQPRGNPLPTGRRNLPIPPPAGQPPQQGGAGVKGEPPPR